MSAMDFEAELMRELCDGRTCGLPEGTMAVTIPTVRTTVGEIRISDQLLSDRFTEGPLPARRVRRRWLRVRAIRLRERVAMWIAPWLDDGSYE